MAKIFLNKTCYESALERIAYIFDNFNDIIVSVSGGKDSTCLAHLALAEAKKRNRKIKLFFLDQEAEYQSTIELMRNLMQDPNVIPMWYQVPLKMTNATSYIEEFLYAWGPGQRWIRDKEPNSIHSIDKKYPERFYSFFEWFEKQQTPETACLVGLRAEESLNRLRAVIKNPGYMDILWSTRNQKGGAYKFYPIYDFGMGDVWKYIKDNNLSYNKLYDRMFADNSGYYNTMRVSNLIHEKSFICLADLQKYEPETYDALVKRLSGVHVASIYAKEDTVFNTKSLPAAFKTWKDYRDYLLLTCPTDKKERFVERFSKQHESARNHRQQCRQLLINDWENNIPVIKEKEDKEDWRAKWYAIL